MITSWFSNRWRSEGGYREVFKIALPLIISTIGWSIQTFIDRMFLFWYSEKATSAALQAGMMSFTIYSLFVATASYANTFVAQYIGAKRPHMVGQAIWQAIYFSIAAGLLMIIVSTIGPHVFRLVGHSPELQKLETTYFRILLMGSMFMFIGDAVSSFFSGRGETFVLMCVNVITVIINCILNWLWIFGKWGFAEMGIAGAGWATVAALAVRSGAFFILMARRKYREQYGTLTGYRFNKAVFLQLLRYGIPSGLAMVFDVMVWTFFVTIVGKLHIHEFSATTVAFQINSLAFMPVIGISIAVSTLVGQRMGKKDPDLAAKSAYSALHIAVFYMGVMALLYLCLPRIFIAPFSWNADPKEFPAIAALIKGILKFVAIYTIFDGITIIISGALKGAGDTKFPFIIQFIFSWVTMGIPIGLLYYFGYRSIWLVWTFGSLYLVSLSFAMLARFFRGKWRSMSVIEEPPPPYVVMHPETPAAEVE